RTEGPPDRHPADVRGLRAFHLPRHHGEVPGAEPAASADRLGTLLRPPAADLPDLPAPVRHEPAAHAPSGPSGPALRLPARRYRPQLLRPAAPAADHHRGDPLLLAAADR